jgi:CO dehydrogenase/acetyl-CoA synthase beta subunit
MVERLDVEIQALIQMINQAMKTISISYNYTVPYINIQDRQDRVTVRRAYRTHFKNFSKEEKKPRAKKADAGVNEIANTLDNTTLKETMAATAQASNEPVAEEQIEEEEEEEEEEEPQRHRHYDSDSDNSVASDVQAAIAASLQDN